MANRQNQYELTYNRLDQDGDKSPTKRAIHTFECKATSVPRAIAKLVAATKDAEGVSKSDLLVLSARMVG